MCLWPVRHWVLWFGPRSSWETLARGCSVDGRAEEESRGNRLTMVLVSIRSRSMAWKESKRQRIGSSGLCARIVCSTLLAWWPAPPGGGGGGGETCIFVSLLLLWAWSSLAHWASATLLASADPSESGSDRPARPRAGTSTPQPQPQPQGPLAHCLFRLRLDSVPFHISPSGDAEPSLGSHLHRSRNQDQLQKTKFLTYSHPSAQRQHWVIAQCALCESRVWMGWNPPFPGVPLQFLSHLPCLSPLTSARHCLCGPFPPLWLGRSFLWLVFRLTQDFPYTIQVKGGIV